MDLSIGISEIVTCVFLISISVIGNTLLIYCTKRCINERLPTSFALIFSLASVHLIKNLVVNVLKIVYATGVWLDSIGCKVLRFTIVFTTSLAIWFTLYIALLYCFKLRRVVHPPVETASTNHRKCNFVLVFALWFAGLAICSPILPFTRKTGNETCQQYSSLIYPTGNETYQQYSSLIYTECETEFGNTYIEFFYRKVFPVAVDILPLIALLLVGFRITYLFWEHKKVTYGGICIGDDTTDSQVLRACKLVLPLMFIITSLWISHFILICCLKDFNSYNFVPPVLTVLSSGYSAVSPYLLMLINYKVKMKVRVLCYKDENKAESAIAVASPVAVSPYA